VLPALAGRVATADAELGRLREAAVPKEVRDLDRLIPPMADNFRSMVAELPAALQRDVDRSRAAIRRLLGGSIRVESSEVEVRSLTEKGHSEAAFLRAAGGQISRRTEVVAGARYRSISR
jgi:hypothetical protein